MDFSYVPFLLTFLAGISTVLGGLITFIKGDNKTLIAASLAFSAGIMFIISVSDLIPTGLKMIINQKYIIFILLLSITLGIMISDYLRNKIPDNNNKLYKLGILSILIIMIHNIPEGIITYIISSNDIELGIKMSLAIAMHNIPEGIIIAIPIYYSTHNRSKAILYTFISGMSKLLGAIITHLFLRNIINDRLLSVILFVTAGIMINIAIKELLPESFNQNKKRITLSFFIIGILFMLITRFI